MRASCSSIKAFAPTYNRAYLVVLAIESMTAARQTRPAATEITAVIALLAMLGLAAVLTWGTWGDWKVDTGYDLYVGSRTLHGSVPYRDLAYYYGPVTPMVLAGAFGLFGESLNTAIATGLLVSAVLVILTYALARQRLGVAGSWLSAALMASGVVCRPALFNGVLPYSWSASLGACGLLLGAFSLTWHIKRASLRTACACGLAIALEALTKPEYAVYLGLVALVVLGLRAATREDSPRLLGVTALTGALPPLVIYGVFAALVGVDKVVSEGILPRSQLASAGLHAIRADAPLTVSALGSFALRGGAYLAGAALLAWLARSLATRRRVRRAGAGAAVVAAAIVCAILAAAAVGDDLGAHGSSTIVLGHGIPSWFAQSALDARDARAQLGWLAQELSRSYTWLYMVVLVTTIALLVRRALPALRARRPIESDVQILLVIALVPTIASAARYASLAASRNNALILPFALILLAELHLRFVARGSRPAAIAGGAWMALLVVAAIGSSALAASRYSKTVHSERGSFRALPYEANAYQGTLDAISALGHDPSVVVAAQGTGLLFLSGAHTPLRQPTLLPGSFTSVAGEEAASAAIRRDPPQAAVIIDRPLTEFGQGQFGETFLPRLSSALRHSLPAAFRYTGAPPARLAIEVLEPGEGAKSNAIVRENARTDGLSATGWYLRRPSDVTVAYAGSTSIDEGAPIELHVSSRRPTYSVAIWRAGWYGAPGVMRRIALLERSSNTSGAATNAGCPAPAPRTGLVRCSWRTTETISTRGWSTGVYLINLRGDDGGMSQTVIVVRDDASHSDILYQASTATWQAYNGWGGKSLYTFNSHGALTVSGSPRAVAVSFDRPYANVSSIVEFNWFLRSELPLVGWLERLGYDVSYTDDVAVAREPALLTRHRSLLVSGHDEYWSARHRLGVERALRAGVSLANFSANTGYWKIRYADGGRTIVCYKTVEGPSGARDPISTTSLWRDPNGPNQPENGLTGGMYVGDGGEGANNASYPLVLSTAAATDRLMRGVGQRGEPLGDAIVGWEWDSTFPNGKAPAGLRVLSRSPTRGGVLWVRGVPAGDGSKTHASPPASGPTRSGYLDGEMSAMATAYRAPSGALVFSTGTNQWAWGLEPMGFRYRYEGPPNVGEEVVPLQQLTANVLGAMGAFPSLPRAAPRVRTGG